MMKSVLLAMALAMAVPAAAQDYRAGSLTIDHPVLIVASPVSKTGAGYMTITNRGKSADRLLAVATAAASRADLHGTVQDGAVMQMRAQSGGVPVPAGASVRFATGGLHVMFIGLKTPLRVGAMVKARLTFERAGPVDVQFRIETAAGGSHSH